MIFTTVIWISGAHVTKLGWASCSTSIIRPPPAWCPAPIMLGILARQTQKSRLLILGNPLPNRNQPVRVAEEMALVDVISKGALNAGLFAASHTKPQLLTSCPTAVPTGCGRRMTLILKAWTTHDGPFNFEANGTTIARLTSGPAHISSRTAPV